MGADFTPEEPKKKIVVGWKKYKEPTPHIMRKLGDGLLAVSMFVIGYETMYDNQKWIVLTALIIGGCGKFLTNFFAEE